MITKKQIQAIKMLQRKKERQQHQQFVVEGRKMVEEAIRYCSDGIVNIYTTDDDFFETHPDHSEVVSALQMEQMSAQKNPAGYLAVLKMSEVTPIVKDQSIFVLETIQDPGNLGTIFRIADWFGVTHIIASNDTVDCYNPKVVQASMGSVFRVQLSYTDLEHFLKNEWPHTIVGTVLDGVPLKESNCSQPSAIVIGNESKGISDAVKHCLTHQVKIEGKGKAESLNAAIATGIIAYALLTE